MKKIILFFILFSSLAFSQTINAQELTDDNSFITKFEYGKMLYTNPRGIGCNTCHGKDAKGKKIVSFKHTYNKKTYECSLVIPGIKNVDHKTFFDKINSKKNKKKKFEKDQVCEKLIYYANVMPTYFLVDEEVEAIYNYVKNLK